MNKAAQTDLACAGVTPVWFVLRSHAAQPEAKTTKKSSTEREDPVGGSQTLPDMAERDPHQTQSGDISPGLGREVLPVEELLVGSLDDRMSRRDASSDPFLILGEELEETHHKVEEEPLENDDVGKFHEVPPGLKVVLNERLRKP